MVPLFSLIGYSTWVKTATLTNLLEGAHSTSYRHRERILVFPNEEIPGARLLFLLSSSSALRLNHKSKTVTIGTDTVVKRASGSDFEISGFSFE